MSIISKEIKSNIIEEMGEELRDRYYNYGKHHLEKIVDECCRQKRSLIDLFSNHPMWNEEKMMIQFDTDIERNICTDEIYKFVSWLSSKIKGYWNYSVPYKYQSKECKICEFIHSINAQFFDDSMTDKINEINSLNENFKLRTNMKSSKAIGKICREEGWDKLEGFNQKYAKVCDCLSPIKVRRHTCISLNPIDFLLMSNGNSWSSCHDIGECQDSGCYSSGTISYMLDQFSFVFYTVDASYDGNQIERQPKIQRQMFGYCDDVIVQLRLYPQSNDSGSEGIYNNIRAIVQKVISDCLNKPNLWVKSKKAAQDIAKKGYDATCYPDWRLNNPGGELCTISYHKEKENKDDLPTFVFGAEPICITCGRRHSYGDSISDCDSGKYCEHCGRRISDDEIRWVNDYAYCDECVTYCEDCQEYVLNDYAQEIDGCYVCDRCLEYGEYYACEECGEVHYVDNLNYDEETEEYYCDDCYERLLEERAEQEDLEEVF